MIVRTTSAPPVSFEQIAGEAVVVAGGGRALLLQIAHPAVGRGVVEHSDFASRMLDRFHATMSFVYVSAFGTPEEYSALLRHINRAHAPVRAASEGAKPAYNAFDPALQLWVAATLYQTMVTIYDRVFPPLSSADRERVYQRMVALDRMLQLSEEHWPPTAAAFDAYWEDTVRSLKVTDDTRRIAGYILDPHGIPQWLRLALPDARLLTAGLLPPAIRQQFELPWDDQCARRYDRRMGLLKAVYPRLPLRLRHSPRDAYLRRLRSQTLARDHGTTT